VAWLRLPERRAAQGGDGGQQLLQRRDRLRPPPGVRHAARQLARLHALQQRARAPLRHHALVLDRHSRPLTGGSTRIGRVSSPPRLRFPGALHMRGQVRFLQGQVRVRRASMHTANCKICIVQRK